MSTGDPEEGTGGTGGGKQIARKTKVRGGHRAHLTKLYGQVNQLLHAYDPSMETDLLALRGSLERKAQIITKLDGEILDETEDDQIEDEIEGADDVQQEIQKITMRINEKLKPKSRGTGVHGSSSSGAAGDSDSSSLSKQMQNMKLPKYEISFDGDPKNYRSFRDLFSVAVEKREGLSDVERFMYLQSFLKGDAEKAIGGLEVTGENFQEAMAILEGRFGNKQLIVNSHMEVLVQIEAVEDEKDTKGLREMYDQVEVQLRSLRTLGVDPETHGILLIPLMKRKLPDEINLLLCRKFDSNESLWKIEDLMKELKVEIEARERSYSDRSNIKEKKKPPRFPPTAGGLVARVSSRVLIATKHTFRISVKQLLTRSSERRF